MPNEVLQADILSPSQLTLELYLIVGRLSTTKTKDNS